MPKQASQPLSFALSSPGAPPQLLPQRLPRYMWRAGSDVLTATPLPRHLPALTFQITLREEQERRPFHLVVPVRAALPPGADPNVLKPVPAALVRPLAPGRNTSTPSRVARP